MHLSRFLTRVRVTVILGAIACSKGAPPNLPPTTSGPGTFRLPPPSSSARYIVSVSDPDEIALLIQQLKLRQAIAARGLLYFEADNSQLGRLRELGYELKQVDPETVDSRVVRVRRTAPEENLRESGVIVVTREGTHWIVSGTIAQLRRLAGAGFRLDSLGPGEPRPRWIRVVVKTEDDVQRVANMEVDIFGVADSAGVYRILGAALDMQIDRLRQAGFTVTLLPTP